MQISHVLWFGSLAYMATSHYLMPPDHDFQSITDYIHQTEPFIATWVHTKEPLTYSTIILPFPMIRSCSAEYYE